MNAQPTIPITLEQEVMYALLKGDDLVRKALLEQYKTCTVTGREVTAVGFFVYFSIPTNSCRFEGEQNFTLGDVSAEIDGLEHGAGFVLFVREGELEMLEGFCYDEKWPSDIKEFRLKKS